MTKTPRRRLPLWPILLGLGLVAFGIGLARLFELRFSAGDVYPPYSTLRSDALGAKALFAALEELPGVRVERNFRPLRRLFAPPFTLGRAPAAAPEGPPPGATTLLLLGLPPERWPYVFTGTELDEIEALARRGVRVVLTFSPTAHPPTAQSLEQLHKEQREERERQEEERRKREGGDEGKHGDGDKLPAAVAARFPADAARRWGVDFYRVRLDSKGQLPRSFTPPPTVSLATPAAPGEVGGETLSWHSAADWNVEPGRPESIWRPLLTRNRGRAVLAARVFGEGSIVLATDSFFLSNEALRDERHAAVLAGVIGPGARRVVFDERHHGLGEDPGMMTLARRYGLEGVLAALGLLVALFLWKSATSLAPPRPEPAAAGGSAESVAGREASAGFLALLRRSVPAAELIPTCLARWQSSHAGRPANEAKLNRLREIAAAERARPAAAYRAMREALRRKG